MFDFFQQKIHSHNILTLSFQKDSSPRRLKKNAPYPLFLFVFPLLGLIIFVACLPEFSFFPQLHQYVYVNCQNRVRPKATSSLASSRGPWQSPIRFSLLVGATAHNHTSSSLKPKICSCLYVCQAAPLLQEALLISAHGRLTFDCCAENKALSLQGPGKRL